MTELAAITLENEMDLTLAYKKSIRTTELLGLTISTQTAFATAVSEVCREVIDKAFDGVLQLGALVDGTRFFIAATITCTIDEYFNRNNEGLEYARKLIPILEVEAVGDALTITLKLGIPRSARVDQVKVNTVKRKIEADGPMSAYEEVKQRNAELNQLNQQHEIALSHATYLDQQKNEFLSVASHELNSPLTVLRSYAQIALKVNGESNDSLKNFLTKINTQSAKIANLVRQLMDISRLEEGELKYQHEKVNVREYLTTITEPLQLLVSTHQLTVDEGMDIEVLMDKLRIEQVINNLVSNAAKYSETGSAITVSTLLSNNMLQVVVEDKGIGMSKETSQRVFEKFYRSEVAEKKYSGLGMGLYVASRIVNDHGGQMNISSKEGEGSVVSFSLPLA